MWSDNETSEDLLGFKVHADLIKEIILDDKMLPTSIGVFGDWGSGKSSIIKMLEKDLKNVKEKKIVSLYFNGWTFEGYDDAKAALIESILKELSKNEKVFNKGKKAAKKLLKRVDLLRTGQFVLKNIAVPAAKAYMTGGLSLISDSFQKFSEFLTSSTYTPEQLIEKLNSEEGKKITGELTSLLKKKKEDSIPDVVRKFRKDFEGAIDESKIDSLVVFVDDLDRCSPDRIIDNLEAIKLFLNVKKTAFIIGADRRIVRNAIQHRYKAKDLRETEIEEYDQLVTDYLEKLIQIPYYLPKLSDTEVESYMSLLIAQNTFDGEKFNEIVKQFTKFREQDRYSIFGYAKIQEVVKDDAGMDKVQLANNLSSLIADGLKGNPRQIKRFLNALTLRQKLAKVANIDDLKEVVLAKLMILEYRENGRRFEDLYNWQKEADGFPVIIQEVEADIENYEKIVEKFSKDWNKQYLRQWFEIAPELSDINLSDYFWLSRDKLGTSVRSSAMVPPIVKNVFNSLINSSADSFVENEIKNIEKKLGEPEYIEYLIDLTKEYIHKEPNSKYAHLIICNMVQYKKTDIATYNDILSKYTDTMINKIPASIGNKLFIISKNGINISDTIKILGKSPKSKVLLLLNDKIEK